MKLHVCRISAWSTTIKFSGALSHDFCYRVGAICLTYTATRQHSCGVVEMAEQLSMATRRELKDAIRERYQAAANRRERRQILSEFARVTVIVNTLLRVLNQPPEIHEALTVLWKAADRICRKRLRVLIPVLIHGKWNATAILQVHPVLRSWLLDVSAATIDRLLRPGTRSRGAAGATTPRLNRVCWYGPLPSG